MTRRGVRVVAVLALIAPVALAMSGCSPVSYPSLFPAVEDPPPARADTPMDANQVQQATEALITDRDRLNVEAQGSGQATAAAAPKLAGTAQNAGSASGAPTAAGSGTK